MKQKPYSIHFVCRGNTYRSRLAAAYMATLINDRFTISSSGIGVRLTPKHNLEEFARALGQYHHLSFGLHGSKTQTNNELLSQADVIVFLRKDIYDEALKRYDFDARKAVVWQVDDIDNELKAEVLAKHSDALLVETTEPTFQKIRRHCDQLYDYLSTTSWSDVVDSNNESTGIRLPINWIADRGLWHRGVHVVVRTADGKYVVGKRVKNIVFSPGMLELTLGGHTDTGEHPLHSAVRETHEELGVPVGEKHFKPLFVYRQNTYHPHLQKYSRTFLYVYAVTLPVHSQHLTPEPEEVEELRVLTPRQVKHLLHTHSMSHFGKLKGSHNMYSRAVRLGALPA